MSDLFDDDPRDEQPRRAAERALARARHHRDRAPGRLRRPDGVRDVLDRAVVVRLAGLPVGVHHAALDPRRAVPGLRLGDGAGRRGQHAGRLPHAAALPAGHAGADRARPLPRRRPAGAHVADGGRERAHRPLRRRVGVRASGARSCCGATGPTSAPPTPTSTATSASTSSTCPGCTTSSTS